MLNKLWHRVWGVILVLTGICWLVQAVATTFGYIPPMFSLLVACAITGGAVIKWGIEELVES